MQCLVDICDPTLARKFSLFRGFLINNIIYVLDKYLTVNYGGGDKYFGDH